MNAAAKARAKRIAEMIRSARAKRSVFSIYSRVKDGAIDTYSAHLATGVYVNAVPTPEELTRSMNIWLGSQPTCFLTNDEVAAQSRQRLRNEHGTTHVIRDITPSVLNSMTAAERLALSNGSGLPDRFKLRIYSDDET